MAEALFVPDGDHFLPTELTRSGWSADVQHGGPPSGLLGRAVELVPTAAPMQVVRFTIDLFRPVPLTPLSVRTTVRRDGRRIQVVDASLCSGDVEVGRATALKIRLAEVQLPQREEEAWVQPPPPAEMGPLDMSSPFGEDGSLVYFHTHAVDIRSLGNSFLRPGPGVSWFRLRQPVVAGEEPTPFQRLATIADMSNGNSQALDPHHFLFVNPDLTLYAHRMPEGEWIGMRSAAHQHDSGIGLADTRVFDLEGPLGRIDQAQLLEPR